MLTEEEIKKLIKTAKKARENSFIPRSGHKIGASVLSEDGEYFGGCTLEGMIFGTGTCAERLAIDHAVAHGKYEFRALAVIDEYQNFPCGYCLQYLMQFFQINEKEITIVVADARGNYQIKTLSELLPYGYLTRKNLEQIKSYRKDAKNRTS